MSALTMKTSALTHTFHALDRSGTRAVCRKNLKPATWRALVGTDEMDRAATFIQSGDTFKRSCSVSRVNCLACQRRLAQELAVAQELAQQWQDVLTGMGTRVNHRVSVTSASGIAVAQGMESAGLVVRVNREPVRALHYRLTALGRRAAGLKAHTIMSRIQGQEYTATGVDHVTADELAEGDVILAEVGGTLDFTRVTGLGKSWIPAHVEWRGVRCNRPRQVLEVHVVGQEDALTYRLDDGVTRAS
jgi:hypothetical protein